MDIEKLQAFICVADTRQISRAAAALGTVPSQLSRTIAALERELGVALFFRTGRGMTLTEAGERIVPRARALLGEYDSLRSELRTDRGQLGGEVRIGMVPSLVRLVVVPLYRRVRELHPRILLHVTEGSSSELDGSRMRGAIDVSLLFRHSRNEIQDEEPLAEVANYLVAPRGDTLTRAGRVPLTALDGVPLLIPGPPNGARVHLEQLAQKRGIDLRVALEASTLNVQAELTAAGCGYSIMPAHAARAQVEEGRLQAALIDDDAFVRTITLSITPARPATAAVREVARLTRVILQEAFAPPA
jgi:DNA-binding transcriptional LysR family regulator